MKIISTPKGRTDYYDYCLYLSNKDIVYNRNVNLVEYHQATANDFNESGYEQSELGQEILKELTNLYIIKLKLKFTFAPASILAPVSKIFRQGIIHSTLTRFSILQCRLPHLPKFINNESYYSGWQLS